jgi:fucose permease
MTIPPAHRVKTPPSYRLTMVSCFVGIFIQAINTTIVAILFIPMMKLYGFSYVHLGLLVGINFISQVVVDLVSSPLIDKFEFRQFVLPADLAAMAGLVLFAASPVLFDDILTGLIISTVIFSSSSGLLKVLLSPIVNAIPNQSKGPTMALMHSFYAWGQVTIIVVTTVFLYFVGSEHWQFIVLFWAVVPLVNFFMFLASPFPATIPKQQRQKMKDIIFHPFYLLALAALFFGTATEVTMNQWASTYTEKVLELPKATGDLLGMCGFAVMLGLGRTLFSRFGGKTNLNTLLIISAIAAALCYVVVALSPVLGISLAACIVCGMAVSLMGPGTLVITTEKFPLAGAWIFAILATAGDIGSAVGPFVAGLATDTARSLPVMQTLALTLGLSIDQLALRGAILLASAFPLLTLLCQWNLHKQQTAADTI